VRFPPCTLTDQVAGACRKHLEALRAERQGTRAHLSVVAGLLQLPVDDVARRVMELHLADLQLAQEIHRAERTLANLAAGMSPTVILRGEEP
jgi:sensor histidine kinase regulating citrate/malate metabolism